MFSGCLFRLSCVKIWTEQLSGDSSDALNLTETSHGNAFPLRYCLMADPERAAQGFGPAGIRNRCCQV